MTDEPLRKTRIATWLALSLVTVLYMALGFTYASERVVVMDEFDSARRVHQLLREVPYRDFQPYKTLVGQLLQAPFVALFGPSFRAIIVVRMFHVVLVGLTLFFVTQRLTKRYPLWAVACVLLALVLHPTFLERSPAFRLDMMTSLCGLVALVLRMEGRQKLAALLVGLSYFVSQKGALFIAAFAMAESSTLLFDRSRANFRRLTQLLAIGVMPAVVYVALCSIFSSPIRVFDAVFLARSREVHEVNAIYSGLRQLFWEETVRDATPFYALFAAAMLVLPLLPQSRLTPDERTGNTNLWIYSASLLVLFAAYPQPWPYFFVMILPTMAIVLVHFLGEVSRVWQNVALSIGVGLALSSVAIAVEMAPLRLSQNLVSQERVAAWTKGYLEPEQKYFAGVALAPSRRHVSKLEWLDSRALVQISEHPQRVVRILEEERPHLIVHNYRIAGLPESVKAWLDERYVFAGGNMMIPGCPIKSGKSICHIVHGGTYRLARSTGKLSIDGNTHRSGDLVTLSTGAHSIDADVSGVLELARQEKMLNEIKDAPYEDLFHSVYRGRRPKSRP